jgi:tetratricopeptide (TPR) repeat protein
VLFALWTNVDGRVVIGLAVVALTWLGRLADALQPGGVGRALVRRVGSIAILVAAACASPSHVSVLRVPPELRSAVVSFQQGVSGESPVNSPFERDYLTTFRDSPSALAYYPLLALGVLSFLLNRRAWRWSWFLPWLGVAVVGGLQVRLVPLFAVVAGAVTAWNLQEYFARRGPPAPLRPRLRYAALFLAVLLGAAFLVAAWPGWLHGPPFEPRRWTIETPGALPQGADFLQRAHTLWPAGTHTLHVSPDTASAFAWFCPEDRGLRDDAAVDLLLTGENPAGARDRLRARGVSRVVVFAGDPGRTGREVLSRLLLDPQEWPVLHLTGGLVVFGWRDPERRAGADPYAGWEVDFARLAFRPDESERAPPARPPHDPPRWWDAFWRPAPPQRSPGRDEATVLYRKAQAAIPTAHVRHERTWEAVRAGELIGAGSGWWLGPYGPIDAALRLGLFRPPIPENAPLPAFTRLALALYERFVFDRGGAPVGTLYAAVRAARRAVAENPGDANAYLVLGLAYGALVGTTAEQSWTAQLPQLRRLRQLQASAALNRAVAINPKLAQAHFQLSRLYLSLEILDLAVSHLRTYQEIPPRWGGPKPGDPQAEATGAELNRLTKLLDQANREFARESEKTSVSDRAVLAVRYGLGGRARDMLLKSDVASLGATGTELELNLLLQTGRADDVREWTTATPEVRGSLGDFLYHSLRAQALIAVGEYDAADLELAEMVGPGGRLPERVGPLVAALVGRALLDERPGGLFLPGFTARAFGRATFEVRIAEITQQLGRSADVQVLRGLVALESGNVDRARESFRAALALSPNRWGTGQLAFQSQQIARACLTLLDGPTDFLPAR